MSCSPRSEEGPEGTTNDTLDSGIQVAIKHHMFERASAPNITDDQLAIVSRWSHRQEKLKLEIQRVQIARERCAQNQLRLQLLARSKSSSFGGASRARSAELLSVPSYPCPTSVPGNSVHPNAQPSADRANTSPSPFPSLPSVNGTAASPSQSDISSQQSEIKSNPDHPVANSSASSAASALSAASAFSSSSQNSECFIRNSKLPSSPTPIPGNFLTPHAQPSADRANTSPSPLPSLPSVNGTAASPSQSDISSQQSEIKSNPDHPVANSSALSALSSPSENSALSTQHSALRECDHLGPLARNWEDVRRRAQIKFGITPEESARRAELRRTWKNPNDNPSANTSIAGNPFNPVENSTPDSNSELSTQHSKLNLFVLLKEITDSVKATDGHLPPPPPEAENTSEENPSAPNQPILETQVVQAPQSS